MVPVISLTTDFGLADGYVGVMHAVILGICPEARIVDLSHEIAPQNVRQAAYVLYTAYAYFPKGAVHIVVVDPGVGSERRAVAIQTKDAYFVAPDNGVLSCILAREEILAQVHLDNPRYWLPAVSHTFHGRDIFAPVGAHLACGVAIDELGAPVGDLVRFPVPAPEVQPDGSLLGHVLHTDRFGNLITDVRQELLTDRAKAWILIAGRRIEGVRTTYASAAEGELVALISSAGHLEIAVRNGSAAQALGAGPGTVLVIQRGV